MRSLGVPVRDVSRVPVWEVSMGSLGRLGGQ